MLRGFLLERSPVPEPAALATPEAPGHMQGKPDTDEEAQLGALAVASQPANSGTAGGEEHPALDPMDAVMHLAALTDMIENMTEGYQVRPPPGLADVVPLCIKWTTRPVLSDVNLSAFLAWTRTQADAFLTELIPRLFSVEHTSAPIPPWLAAMTGSAYPVAVPVGIVLKDTGEVVNLPRLNCAMIRRDPETRDLLGISENCPRCESGKGGYQFKWVCASWTPLAAFPAAGETPTAARIRCNTMEWPIGMIRLVN